MSSNDTPAESSQSTWQLPDGIEDVIESGIIKASVGALAGGLVGSILFKSGNGMRPASVAMGMGVALGSTVERACYSKH